MPRSGLFSWFFSKRESDCPGIWHAETASVQKEQPTSPAAPSAERVVVMQSDSQVHEVKLRGGGAGDLCCGLCAGLLCFECCEECC